MNTWKYIIIAALALLSPALPAIAGDREKILGTWAETSPKDNVVSFAADGGWKIYLKKGEIGELHFLDGKWQLLPDGKLKIVMTVEGQTKEFTAKLKFEKEELVLIDDDGSQTRHKRHTGPLPERFQW